MKKILGLLLMILLFALPTKASTDNDSLHVVYTLSDDTKNPFEFEIQTYAIEDFFENNTFEIIESERSRLNRFLLILLVTIILIVSSIATVSNRKIKR